MPTQEELNAAQVELDIANDNYAQLADRYNKYQQLFQTYASSSPEIQNRAADAMWRALEDYYQTQEKMRAAEERIAQAQNTINSYNEIIANQPAAQPTTTTRRVIRQNPGTATVTEPNIDSSNIIYTYNGPVQQESRNFTEVPSSIVWYTSNWNPIYWPATQSIPESYTQEEINKYWLIWPQETIVSTWTPEVAWVWQSGTQNWWRISTTTTNNSFWWAGWTYNADGSMTSPNWQTKVYSDWSISFWPVSTAQTYAKAPTITTATPRRRINITPSANPIDRIKWTYNMGVWANNTLYNVAKARVGYNNLTDWNWISWLRNNLQWWVNMVKGAAWAVKWAAQFNKWLNQFQWNL